jgi:uncharacterized protein YdhG (YjbR/CyaY superfamily)
MTTIATVEEYMAAQKPEAGARLQELRNRIVAAVPQAEVMSYGMPTRCARVAFPRDKAALCAYGAAIDLLADELGNLESPEGSATN